MPAATVLAIATTKIVMTYFSDLFSIFLGVTMGYPKFHDLNSCGTTTAPAEEATCLDRGEASHFGPKFGQATRTFLGGKRIF